MVAIEFLVFKHNSRAPSCIISIHITPVCSELTIILTACIQRARDGRSMCQRALPRLQDAHRSPSRAGRRHCAGRFEEPPDGCVLLQAGVGAHQVLPCGHDECR